MTATIVNPAALNHLGAVIHHIRPAWDPPGIHAALERALTAHDYRHVATIAITAAADPKANTPAVIPVRCANGWMATTEIPERPTPGPPQAADMRCRQCNAWLIGDETHNCHDRAHPDHARTMRDQAVAAAKAAARPAERKPE